ncbi:Thymidylate kinase [Rhizina undulata]
MKLTRPKRTDRTTPIGQLINNYLSSTQELPAEAIHLLFSANRWELASQLLQHLEAGTTVILDRYVHSGIAFSVAKGLPYDFCRNPEIGLPKPDVVVFLDLSEEEAQKRAGYGGERYEKLEFQRKVRGIFEGMREKEGGAWRVVDSGREPSVVEAEVWDVVREVVEKVESEGTEVGKIE